MTAVLPHDSYMDLVHAHLSDLGIFPAGFWTETPDGDELVGVFEFPDHAISHDEWPDDVYLSWTQFDGWVLTSRGANRTAYPLDLDTYSTPASVAALVRSQLAGTPPGPADPDIRGVHCVMNTAVQEVDGWAGS